MLTLGGGSILPADVAAALAAHAGTLSLPAVNLLTPEAALALAPHRGVLCLPSVSTLSTETAEALALHQGSLVLSGLVTLEPAAARALSGHGGDIDLFKLTQTPQLDSADVAGLLADKTPLLSLPNVNRMDGQESIAVARALAGGGGTVSIPNLRVASPLTVAALLANGNVSLPPIQAIEFSAEPVADSSAARP